MPTVTQAGRTRSSLASKVKVKALVTQSCTTLCDPMDCNPPEPSVHEILQTRILEWVAIIEPASPALWADSLPAEPAWNVKQTPNLCDSKFVLHMQIYFLLQAM